eukprot:1080509-Pyramimonas_sp.AAC.2
MGQSQATTILTLEEGAILGGGSHGLVRLVTDPDTKRQFALKRMKKASIHPITTQNVILVAPNI